MVVSGSCIWGPQHRCLLGAALVGWLDRAYLTDDHGFGTSLHAVHLNRPGMRPSLRYSPGRPILPNGYSLLNSLLINYWNSTRPRPTVDSNCLRRSAYRPIREQIALTLTHHSQSNPRSLPPRSYQLIER